VYHLKDTLSVVYLILSDYERLTSKKGKELQRVKSPEYSQDFVYKR